MQLKNQLQWFTSQIEILDEKNICPVFPILFMYIILWWISSVFHGSLKCFVHFSAAKLPKKMEYGPRMSPSPDGSSVVLTYLKDIYKLNCQSERQCTWELLPNKLQVSRQYHIQVTVPAVQNCWKIYMFECTYTPDFLCTHS